MAESRARLKTICSRVSLNLVSSRARSVRHRVTRLGNVHECVRFLCFSDVHQTRAIHARGSQSTHKYTHLGHLKRTFESPTTKRRQRKASQAKAHGNRSCSDGARNPLTKSHIPVLHQHPILQELAPSAKSTASHTPPLIQAVTNHWLFWTTSGGRESLRAERMSAALALALIRKAQARARMQTQRMSSHHAQKGAWPDLNGHVPSASRPI